MTRSQATPSLRGITRRHFFEQSAFGIGGLALASLMDDVVLAGAQAQPRADGPAAARRFAPKAKRVIYLFMAGAPSQIDLFDPKPTLTKHDGQDIPDELVKGERFAFIKGKPKLLASPFQFKSYGQSGADLGAPAQPREGRRRPHDHPLDADDAVQPRAGADLHEHRPSGHRPAEPRVVAELRAGQREQRPARLRRAALGREQPRRRQVVLGQRLSARRCTRASSSARTASRCSSSRTPTASTPTCAIARSPRSTT